MIKKISLIFLAITALAVNFIMAPNAIAQAYRSQMHFLEEFAVRQYEQGNLSAASKEFQRILRIDPSSTLAREYLQKIAATPNVPSTTKANIHEVLNDLVSIKEQLNDYEKDVKDLEYMIRNLITENDALYQSLYKRSREVIELREKFYGTPYGDIYASVMKDLPIDRVPQRLHPSNDILPDSPTPAYAQGSFAYPVDTKGVNALIADINMLASQGKPLNTPINSNAELYNALDAKRSTLIDTTVATAEKYKNLEKIKDELTTINTDLKRGVDRYMEAIHKIDNYYKNIKEEIARKNFIEQKQFNDLVADYADRIKEIEQLKKNSSLTVEKLTAGSITGSENDKQRFNELVKAYAERVKEIEELKRKIPPQEEKLTSYKTILSSDNANITDLKKTMLLRDNELANMKTLLVKLKKELSQKDALIKEQKSDLDLTDKQLNAISDQVSAIEKGLVENNTAINELNNVITPGVPLAKPEKKVTTEADITTAINNVDILKVQAQNANLEARINLNEKALGKSGMRIKNLERQLATVTSDLNKALVTQDIMIEQPLLDKIKSLETVIAQKNTAIKELQQKFDAIPKELSKTLQSLEAVTAQKNELSESLRQSNKKMTNLEYTSNNKISQLEQTLASKDQYLSELSESVAQLQHDARSVAPLSAKRAEDNDAVLELQMRLRRSQDLLSEAETAAARSNFKATDLSEKLAAKDLQIEQLNQLLSVNQSDELKSAKRQLTDQDAAITALTHENRALKDQLERNMMASHAPSSETPATSEMMAKDKRIAELEKMLTTPANSNASAFDVVVLKNTIKQLEAQKEAALDAQTRIGEQLKDNETALTALEKKVADLRRDIATASNLIAQKDRDHDAAMAEIKRLNDLIEKKNNELLRLHQTAK